MNENEKQLFKLKKKLFRQIGRAIEDFSLVEPGDRIMVAVSGGKDSWALLYLLDEMRRKAPISFELVAVHLDQGEPYAPVEQIREALSNQPVPWHVMRRNVYETVEEKLQPGRTRCSLCSRLRRGALYNIAVELGCNKMALGHHRDDLLETLLMNQFFSGSMATMPPKLTSSDGRNIVIRPLCYVAENHLREYCDLSGITTFACQSCDLAMNQRGKVKRLLEQLEADIPEVRNSLLSSLSNIRTTHLLDNKLWESSDNPLPRRS